MLRAGQSDLLRQLEQTIPSGRPVLIEEVGEELDPSLDPLLSRSIQKQGGVEMIQLGDGMVSPINIVRNNQMYHLHDDISRSNITVISSYT